MTGARLGKYGRTCGTFENYAYYFPWVKLSDSDFTTEGSPEGEHSEYTQGYNNRRAYGTFGTDYCMNDGMDLTKSCHDFIRKPSVYTTEKKLVWMDLLYIGFICYMF